MTQFVRGRESHLIDKAMTLEPHGLNRRDELLLPQGFRPEAKSRGGTLVTRAYIKEVLTVQIYSQYTRKNLDLLEQGPRGIGR